MGAAISKKTVGRPFQPGQSGNPNGRPKMPKDLKEAFKAASPKALEILKKILADPAAKDSDRLRAAEIILDRAYGKPARVHQGRHRIRRRRLEFVIPVRLLAGRPRRGAGRRGRARR